MEEKKKTLNDVLSVERGLVFEIDCANPLYREIPKELFLNKNFTVIDNQLLQLNLNDDGKTLKPEITNPVILSELIKGELQIKLNRMYDIANILNIELNQEFKIENYQDSKFKLKSDGVWMCNSDLQDSTYFKASEEILQKLIEGSLKIISPYYPQMGECFWAIDEIVNDTQYFLMEKKFEGTFSDCALLTLGMCYRTKEEAEAQMYQDRKKFKMIKMLERSNLFNTIYEE